MTPVSSTAAATVAHRGSPYAKLMLFAALSVVLLAVGFAARNDALAHEGRQVGDYHFSIGFINEPAYEGVLNGVSLKVTRGSASGMSGMEQGGDAMDSDGDVSGDDSDEDVDSTHDGSDSDAMTDDDSMMSDDDSDGDAMGMSMAMHGADAEPVTGLAEVLMVKVTHVPSGTFGDFGFRESRTEPGLYEAHFIPTAVGEYEFHVTGEIEGMEVDESFTSGPDTFDTVESPDAIQFPNPIRSQRELESAVSGARSTASQAEEEAGRGSRSANIALGLGLVAIVLALGGAAAGGYALLAVKSRKQ